MTDTPERIQEPRTWRDNGWTAQVIKNDDDDGWAVAMYRDGETEPALVGPWTMGRDKKNPKPLDTSAFLTLVKTATEFVRRSEQQRDALLHPSLTLTWQDALVTVSLDIEPDDEHPSARLSARNADGELRADVPVSPGFKLTRSSALAWLEAGCAKPRA